MNAPSQLPALVPSIFYAIPVEDSDPYKASLLQGFAPSLLKNSGIVRMVSFLPSDIFEKTPDGAEVLLQRRMAGQSPVRWFGVAPNSLKRRQAPVAAPFMVMFFGPDHSVSQYQSWIDGNEFPLLAVAEKGGTIGYEQFSVETMRTHFLNVCSVIEGKVDEYSRVAAIEALENWKEPVSRNLRYQVGGHNCVYPNLTALTVAGFDDMVYGEFKDINNGDAPYVAQITKTANSILDQREQVPPVAANMFLLRQPDVNLFAPRIYPHAEKFKLSGMEIDEAEKKRFKTILRILSQQSGYAFELKSKAQIEALMGEGSEADMPRPHFLMAQRAEEWKFGTHCVGALSASEFSAVLRLPNAVNRTSGQVRQFASHYRGKNNSDRKRVTAFREVQRSITNSVPADFVQVLDRSVDGIRIISDAHLEWLDLHGLPLTLQKKVSRIPVTPGNLFVEMVGPRENIHLSDESFREVLILSALHDRDPISAFFDKALEAFSKLFQDKLSVRKEIISNRTQMIDALNSYSGPLVMFDGHGSHRQDHPAHLHLIDEDIDVWSLRGELVSPPPIVLLSACDTHAADRNHASTANGFFALGSRAVLASVFPLHAMDAASFAARLLYRVAEFIPAAHKTFERSLSWTEVVSGMLRMQFLSDVLKRLEAKKMISGDSYSELGYFGNKVINTLRDRPFDAVVEELTKYGIEKPAAWREMRAAAASSSSISYLHVGRPETILIHPENVVSVAREQND